MEIRVLRYFLKVAQEGTSLALPKRRAEEILELVDKTERKVSGHDDIVEGTVSAGRGDLANVEMLAELLRGFHARYRNPHISLQQIAAANDQGE